MDIAPLFLKKTALKEQLDDPRAGCLRAQTVGGAQDLLQIFILHEPGDAGHRGKQRRIGKMARRLGLAFHHFPFFTQQLIVFGDHGKRRTVVLFVTLFVAEQRAPACFREETGFGDKLPFCDFQLDHAFAEHRVRAELHQVLTSDQVVDLRFVIRQVDAAGARRRDNRVVGVHLFVVPAAVMGVRVHHRLRQQIRRVHAYGVHHRMTTGKMLFRQVAAIRTRIGDQLVGFIELLADIQHVLRAEAKALCGLDLQGRQRERQRRGF